MMNFAVILLSVRFDSLQTRTFFKSDLSFLSMTVTNEPSVGGRHVTFGTEMHREDTYILCLKHCDVESETKYSVTCTNKIM